MAIKQYLFIIFYLVAAVSLLIKFYKNRSGAAYCVWLIFGDCGKRVHSKIMFLPFPYFNIVFLKKKKFNYFFIKFSF